MSATVTLNATASDNVGVTDVKFYVDNSTTALGTDSTSPYSASWNTTTVTNGAHMVKAVARDAAGNITTSTVNRTHRRQCQTDGEVFRRQVVARRCQGR